jgi:hypothetical protein
MNPESFDQVFGTRRGVLARPEPNPPRVLPEWKAATYAFGRTPAGPRLRLPGTDKYEEPESERDAAYAVLHHATGGDPRVASPELADDFAKEHFDLPTNALTGADINAWLRRRFP